MELLRLEYDVRQYDFHFEMMGKLLKQRQKWGEINVLKVVYFKLPYERGHM